MSAFRAALLALILVLAFVTAGRAQAGFLPDWELSTATCAYQGNESVSLMHVPDGTGDPFTAGFLPYGTRVNASITVTLLDPAGSPIAGYPYEDIWLESADGGLAFCRGGSQASYSTDINGQTVFADRLRGGGASEALLLVLVSGQALASTAGLNIRGNSPDIDASGRVDIVDVVAFAADFFGSYAYRSDFQCDGVINLSDVGRFAAALGASCP